MRKIVAAVLLGALADRASDPENVASLRSGIMEISLLARSNLDADFADAWHLLRIAPSAKQARESQLDAEVKCYEA